MPRRGYKNEEAYVAQAVEGFKRDSAIHEVRQLHRDGDTVKLWRCGRPNSSVFMFYVCSAPNCLSVWGDMNECMWQRHHDMLPFIRGSIHSLDYFSEKVPSNIQIREFKDELAQEYLDCFKDEWIDAGGEWDDEMEEKLDTVCSEYQNYGSPYDLRKAIFDEQLDDEPPSFEYYTYQYLWIIEGLKWFIQKLDAGEVLPYEREE